MARFGRPGSKVDVRLGVGIDQEQGSLAFCGLAQDCVLGFKLLQFLRGQFWLESRSPLAQSFVFYLRQVFVFSFDWERVTQRDAKRAAETYLSDLFRAQDVYTSRF